MTRKTRFVIVHYHLFKNAGTTLNRLLERNFSGELAYLHGDQSTSSLAGPDLLQFLEANPQIRAVSSHHLRPPSPGTEDFVFFDILSVRNPLDRLRSMYDFYHRSAEGDDPLIAYGKERDIAGFFELLLDRCPHLVNNVQVNYFANAGRYTRPPDDKDLQRAVDIIVRSAAPVVTELFDCCAVSAEYFLQPAFGKLDFSCTPENVSGGRLLLLSDRIKALRQSCGRRLYQELLRTNDLDFKLVKRIETEVERRFRLIPNAKNRFEDFRQRCRMRATASSITGKSTGA